MIKSLLLGGVILLASNFVSISGELSPVTYTNNSCGHNTPYGFPVSIHHDSSFTPVCHAGYMTHVDNQAKIPDWVVYFLTPLDSMGCANRSNSFKKDPQLSSNSQAAPEDYIASGYDKGHIANDEDMRWDPEVEKESFFMSNMTPQKPSFNRGIWKNLEDDVRNWAVSRGHNLLIYAGPIYNYSQDSKIGKDKVDVPDGFYKIIIDDDNKESIAFKFTDQNTANDDTLDSHIDSIEDIQKITGITFPVPDTISKTSKSSMWTYIKGLYTKQKKQICSSHN